MLFFLYNKGCNLAILMVFFLKNSNYVSIETYQCRITNCMKTEHLFFFTHTCGGIETSYLKKFIKSNFIVK